MQRKPMKIKLRTKLRKLLFSLKRRLSKDPSLPSRSEVSYLVKNSPHGTHTPRINFAMRRYAAGDSLEVIANSKFMNDEKKFGPVTRERVRQILLKGVRQSWDRLNRRANES